MGQENEPVAAFTPEMLKAPKARRPQQQQQDRKTLEFNIKYERYVGRENVQRASINMKRVLGAHAIILAGVIVVLIYTIVFNINRGDAIFPGGTKVGDSYTISWTGWHAWLENLSLIIAILTGAIVAIMVSAIAFYAHYRPQLLDREMDDFMSASAQAENDIEVRKAFKAKYNDLYEDIKEGRVKVTAAAPAEPATPGQPTIIKAALPLPPIKLPPKINIAAPGMVNLPIPTGAAPPIPGEDGGRKKKPTGPIEGEKKIYVRCERCNKTLGVGIPRKLVLENELEVVPISIIHGEGNEKHILTVFLDPDFKSRRDRVSDMLVFQ